MVDDDVIVDTLRQLTTEARVGEQTVPPVWKSIIMREPSCCAHASMLGVEAVPPLYPKSPHPMSSPSKKRIEGAEEDSEVVVVLPSACVSSVKVRASKPVLRQLIITIPVQRYLCLHV